MEPNYKLVKDKLEMLLALGSRQNQGDLSKFVNARNNQGKTPLHCLASSALILYCNKSPNECREIFNLLVDNGADVNALDKQGITPVQEYLNRNVPKEFINPVIAMFKEKGATVSNVVSFVQREEVRNLQKIEKRHLNLQQNSKKKLIK
jgi:hypothetical protein